MSSRLLAALRFVGMRVSGFGQLSQGPAFTALRPFESNIARHSLSARVGLAGDRLSAPYGGVVGAVPDTSLRPLSDFVLRRRNVSFLACP